MACCRLMRNQPCVRISLSCPKSSLFVLQRAHHLQFSKQPFCSFSLFLRTNPGPSHVSSFCRKASAAQSLIWPRFPFRVVGTPYMKHVSQLCGTVAGMQEAVSAESPVGGGAQGSDMLGAVMKELGSSLKPGPVAPRPRPLVIVVSGPSGVGKDAVIRTLQEQRPDLHFVVTATTRSKRDGEVHGKDYLFVSREEFLSMIDSKELLEHALVYGEYKGIPKQQVREALDRGTDVVLRVDVQGARTVRSILGDGVLSIFLVAESEKALVERLVERKSENLDRLLVRVKTAREEVARLNEFDYVVVNEDGQIEKTVSDIASIIVAEKSRVHQRNVKL